MSIDLRNSDALNMLDTIESESVDLVVTDPPYRIMSRGSSGSMGGYWKSDIAKSGRIFKYNDVKPEQYLGKLYRVLKNGTILYLMTNNLNLIEMLNEATKVGFKFVKSIIWNKGNKICGKYYMGCYEHILLLRKGKDRPINNCGTPDIISVPINKLKDENGNNLHDTEKPVDLMKILVENSSDIGETVLDPFMGIGSCGVASKMLGRNFIGFEIDGGYFEIAQKRINKTETELYIKDLEIPTIEVSKSTLW